MTTIVTQIQDIHSQYLCIQLLFLTKLFIYHLYWMYVNGITHPLAATQQCRQVKSIHIVSKEWVWERTRLNRTHHVHFICHSIPLQRNWGEIASRIFYWTRIFFSFLIKDMKIHIFLLFFIHFHSIVGSVSFHNSFLQDDVLFSFIFISNFLILVFLLHASLVSFNL